MIVTDAPASIVGNGSVTALAVTGASSEPKMLRIPPGAKA